MDYAGMRFRKLYERKLNYLGYFFLSGSNNHLSLPWTTPLLVYYVNYYNVYQADVYTPISIKLGRRSIF